MDKNKKNIDYWDKYYGSGKDKKDTFPEYNRRYSPKSQKENEAPGKAGKNSAGSRGRIIGSEYKVRPSRRKKRASPVARIVFFIIAILLIGYFIFYAIDNQLFSKGKTSIDKVVSGSSTSNENISSGSSNDNTVTSDGLPSPTDVSGSSVQDNMSAGASDSGGSQQVDTKESSSRSFWQALLLFFKNFGKNKAETANYPSRLNINTYFAVMGNDKIFGSEKRSISAGSPKSAAANALNELINGPYENFNFAVIPAGTKLLGIEVTNKIAKVNLSQEFLSESLDSSILDDYIVYTIVNTLTEIPGIEAVTFAIEGKDIRAYGNVDLHLPAIRNDKYLENKSP